MPERRQPYIERDGRFWHVVIPAGSDDGLDTCLGPIFTKWGARLSLRFHNWMQGPSPLDGCVCGHERHAHCDACMNCQCDKFIPDA